MLSIGAQRKAPWGVLGQISTSSDEPGDAVTSSGLGCAILLSEVAPRWSRDILKPAIETLAGIPSVVYGFFGLILIVPFIMNNLGGGGLSVLACGIVLAIMILPTIISISEDALRSVPREYREGALAIGATKWQMITGIVVPAARSGILASAILGMGRAIGETMAVWMVSGNTRLVPTSLLSSVAPMSSQIALEWNYASGDHRTALFAIGIVLLAIIMLLNLIVYWTSKERLVERV
jgi:phosphate transport system permease protein